MRSPKRVGAIVVGCMLLLAAFGAVWEWHPWNPRMGADRAARALEQRLNTSVRYECGPAESDAPLKDADYLCEPVGGSSGSAYWVATDRYRITAIEPAG